MMRIASYRIHQSLVQKPLSLNQYWPLKYMDNLSASSDKIMALSEEEYQEIKKRHGIN